MPNTPDRALVVLVLAPAMLSCVMCAHKNPRLPQHSPAPASQMSQLKTSLGQPQVPPKQSEPLVGSSGLSKALKTGYDKEDESGKEELLADQVGGKRRQRLDSSLAFGP